LNTTPTPYLHSFPTRRSSDLKAFPRILEYIKDMHNEALWNHFVVSPFGQRKMQYGTIPCFKKTAVYNGALRNAQNVRIQGPTSSDRKSTRLNSSHQIISYAVF